MNLRKISILMFVLFLCLFLAGCVDEDLTAEQAVQKYQEKQETIEDYSATVHTTLYYGGEELATVYTIIKKNPDKFKTISLESLLNTGVVSISNGETLWEYNPDLNSVVITNVSDNKESSSYEDYTGIMQTLLDQNFILNGTEVVDGRDCYAMSVVSNNSESSQNYISSKVWIDKEIWMPIKIEMYDSEGTLFMDTIYEDCEVNTGISDSEFEFDVPEDARVVEFASSDLFSMVLEPTSLEEVENLSGREIMVPSYVPEGYEFDNATFDNSVLALGVDMEMIKLIYTNGSNDIWVTETFYGEKEKESMDDYDSFLGDYSETVFVNGNEAILLSDNRSGTWASLSWEQDGISMAVSGKIGSAELIKIAESIK
jgi:outer membrane lipoprotein-sorting protein